MSKVSPALRLPSFGGKTGAARRSRPSNATCRQKSARQWLLHRSLRLRGPRTGQNEVREKLFPSSQRRGIIPLLAEEGNVASAKHVEGFELAVQDRRGSLEAEPTGNH